MATINWDRARELYTTPNLKGQFIDYLRNVDSSLDFSGFEGVSDEVIFDRLSQESQEINLNANNPSKPLDIKPKEQIYQELRALDRAENDKGIIENLSHKASQVLDQINPTPLRSKELEERAQKQKYFLNHLKKLNIDSQTFTKEYGESPFLREAYFENQDIFSNIYDLSHDLSAQVLGKKSAQAKAYDKELESYNTYKSLASKKLSDPSNYYKLSKQEQRIIDDSIGAVSAWWRNNSEKEKVDYFLDLQNAKESASNFVAAQKRLENVNTSEQFLGLIGAITHGKDFSKQQKQMLDDYAIVAKELGFDTLAYNKTGLYFIKDEKAYKVEQGFWNDLKEVFKNNISSFAGAVAGAEYGYKKKGFKGMVAYGALGAFAGGVNDSMIADMLANKDIDLAQALIHGAQEGALNIAADAVLKVAGTAIKSLNPQKIKDIAGTAVEYTPVIGFISRAHDGNKAAAQKLIDTAIPKQTQENLKELEGIFGAELHIGQATQSKAQQALESIKQTLGEQNPITKGAQKFYDTFAFTDQKSAQKDFIRAIRADESGNLTAFLSEAANASPTIQKNLQAVLATTTQKLLHQLERFNLQENTIKEVFNNFEKGTKDSYKQAIEDILQDIYDDSYKVVLSKEQANIPEQELGHSNARFNTISFDLFKQKMQESGILLEDSAKFLSFVEHNIYNPKGVTFESLNNALKTMNAYYKQASDPNFRSFVKDALNGFIKRDIQAGIEGIFKQNAALYNDARTLFDTALNDYAKMKDTLKIVDKLKIRDKSKSYDEVANALSKFLLAQGDKIPNFEALLGGLQKELREQVEIKLLQDMLNLSLSKLNDIQVLDSTAFFKRLNPLKAHFTSTSAKDFIKIAQDFHTLFSNDHKILEAMRPTTTEKVGSSIATTLEGAVRFQVIKALFSNIVRLMPYIPFAKGLNERVQGAALRYHLKKALESSLSVGEFKLDLQARNLKADFTNATKEQIAKILGQVESAESELESIGKGELESTTPKVDPSTHTPQQTLEAPTQNLETKQIDQNDPTTQSTIALAKAEREAKQEQEAIKHAEQEAHDQAQAQRIKDANDTIQSLKDARAGASEMEREIHLGAHIPRKQTDLPSTSIATDDNNIYELDFVIVKASDLKPNFTASGLQPRTQKEREVIESIARDFKPEMILGRGGYKDLPIIAPDGQVITGNHRVQGFKDFTLARDGSTPREITKAQALEILESTPPAPMPLHLSEQEFLQGFEHFTNKENFIAHLHKAPDSAQRIEALKLVEPTRQNPDLQLETINAQGKRTKEFIKVFDAGNKNKFYILVTQADDESILLTGIPTTKLREIKKRIENANKLEARDPGVVSSARSHSSTPTPPSIIAQLESSRAAYEKAIKDRYGITLASDELLLRTPRENLTPKELLSIAYNSNKEDIKNLGDHIYSVLGRYAPYFKELPRQLESSSYQELKSKIARILDKSPYPDENAANLAVLANTIKANNNANIAEMLNTFSKLPKADAQKVLQTFTDTAGLWHILSNNAVEYGLKNLDLRPYLLGAMHKAALSLNESRAANFKELNTQIQHLLDTTDSNGSNLMLEIMPNTYDNLISDLLGSSLARFLRLENPSENLYEALKNANKGLSEQLAPKFDLFGDGGVIEGRSIDQADIFDFIEYMIAQGERGAEVAKTTELLPKLREKYNAYKGTPPTTPSGSPKPSPEAQEAKASKSSVESSLTKKSHREQIKQQLQHLKNLDIPHKSGIVARLSSTGIDKMLSDKAIQKSLDNGFTQEQHFNAVADIERLFKNSDFSHTEAPKNQSADIIGVHRYINDQDLQDQNAQALITLKESLENGNRIYSIELEALAHPSSVDRSPKSKGVENSHHDDAGATQAARLFENPSDILPQPTQTTEKLTPKQEEELESSAPQISKEVKDIIDSSPAKGRDMQIIGEANFTPQVVEYAHKNNKKVAIDKLGQAEAERLGFKYPQDVRVTIDYQAINHTLNRHGAESNLVKESGQKAVDYNDIAEYRNIVKTADESVDSVDNLGQEVIISFKQINGHAVAVESIRKKGNELAFKTMYFENGSYKNSNAYKNAVESPKGNPSPAPYGYEPHADANTSLFTLKANDEIIPQPTQTTEKLTPKQEEELIWIDAQITYTQKKLQERKQELADFESGKAIESHKALIAKELHRAQLAEEQFYKETTPTDPRKRKALARLFRTTTKHFQRMLSPDGIQNFIKNHHPARDIERLEKQLELLKIERENLLGSTSQPKIPTITDEYIRQTTQNPLKDYATLDPKAKEALKETFMQKFKTTREQSKKWTDLRTILRNFEAFDDETALQTLQAQEAKASHPQLESSVLKESPESSDIIFTDTKGKEHTLTQEAQEQWLKTFNLKSLDESYIPSFTPEVQQALDSILQGEKIKLTSGSLLKLIQRDRLEFLPYIKNTLEHSDIIIKDKENALIFAKDIGQTSYFTSVSKNDKGEWIISTNSYKTINQLKNRVNDNGEILYISKEAPNILAEAFTTKAFSNELANDIIPQKQATSLFDSLESNATKWKTQGKYNKEVLLKNAKASPYPHHADEAVKSESISNPSLEQGSPLQSRQSTNDSSIKTFNQGDIALESMDDFARYARLVGFSDLSQEQLERAHKHIKAHIEKIKC